jgi:hypothetical protein
MVSSPRRAITSKGIQPSKTQNPQSVKLRFLRFGKRLAKSRYSSGPIGQFR